MQVLDRTSPLPLWAQLVDELRRRLLDGDLGGRLPPEPRLASDYQVSRQTVREAIRRLRDAGLLTAERGRGTFVRTPEAAPRQQAGARSLVAALESGQLGPQATVRALDRIAEPRAAARLGLPATAALIHLVRVWTVDGTPVAYDRVWLPEAAEPLLDVDFRRITLHQALERWCGIRVDGAAERVGIVMPTGEPRRLLGLDKREPALMVEHQGRAGDRPVEWGETMVRGDRGGMMVEWSLGGCCSCAFELDVVSLPQPPRTPLRATPA